MGGAGQNPILAAMREQHTKPFEHVILDWVEANGLEDVVFYPQDNPTILITWSSPDSEDRWLFREIDVVVQTEDSFRCAGGAIYHDPDYYLSWFPASFVSTDELPAALDEIKTSVDALGLDDLTDMESFVAGYVFRLEI
ncbi:hypothetical protein HN371_25140 [Candidatus Poribacteria bacterium]|jgi:hypothetical protein|nr:hypothetical protein [Candidatus Poribacteria bacterium]MBT5532512.1 hypothetical protein [Candidatus Poribacteria bacterium]MBT5714767.1 hypothetical protein [Candidatus Poribacteria bacterium]MBT7098025.1 hypothetical protein [Candidatus Poribacteria bacterium]MBT7809551.1 hypothetical protein [Candidatus Poribacteria bacterium]